MPESNLSDTERLIYQLFPVNVVPPCSARSNYKSTVMRVIGSPSEHQNHGISETMRDSNTHHHTINRNVYEASQRMISIYRDMSIIKSP